MLQQFLSIIITVVIANDSNGWELLSDHQFSPREGLMAVSAYGSLIMTGGRQSGGFSFANDIWKTSNGSNWVRIVDKTPFDGRAYHNMVVMKNCIYVMAGQTFSEYYNDIWKSCDGTGTQWSQVTSKADWPVRAGAAALVTKTGELIIAGGCYNNKGTRSFYNDVWSSTDGIKWKLMTNKAEWSARSGPRLIEFNNALFLVAGERGFTADVQLGDVWKSTDGGATWILVTKTPGFSPRSGHGVIVSSDNSKIILIAGWPELHDLWSSTDGVSWVNKSNAVWNCKNTSCGKYDFWCLTHNGKIYTVGGSGATSTFGKLYADTWSLV